MNFYNENDRHAAHVQETKGDEKHSTRTAGKE